MYSMVTLCVCVQSLSCVPLFATPWTVACQAPLSMEFYRQEYWRGQPFPTPGKVPNPGIKLMFLVSPALAGRFFTTTSSLTTMYCKLEICYDGRSQVFQQQHHPPPPATKKVTMGSDGYISQFDCSNHFTRYIFIETSWCLPQIQFLSKIN